MHDDTAEDEFLATLAFLELEAVEEARVWNASLILMFHGDERAVEEDHSYIPVSNLRLLPSAGGVTHVHR